MLNNIAGVLAPTTPLVTNSYESIQTVTVGSGGQATITFSSIPSTFKHLQLRFIGRGTGASGGGNYIGMRFNSDTSSSYSEHQIDGNGSTLIASAATSQTTAYVQRIPNASNTASVFGAGIIDILDYASTTKNKTVRELGGFDLNGSGDIFLVSNLWYNGTIAAINSITLTPETGNFAEFTSFALYGIKG